ncbi:sugar phosphate isomerase/epimerase family protein [Chitinophaga arvensicola]|uniref:Sugar phosphate isomerase/epimerase n=1 Tax=Chitinophaga arvensicola TaxID=29529 RepID=A0A1I0RVK4_9BACT|nr:sugar phosphate isomerase/epimerase [Chitinophaga arvensicola]SEW45533.1 Sugar phosphate isomerase/epimerase [Chitinophaga arvensicola]
MRKSQKSISGIVLIAILFFTGIFTSNAQTKKDVGLQLYSLRELLPKDVKGTLEKVSQAGYTQVELYGFNIKDQFWGLTPVELRKILDEYHLKPISGHFNMTPYFETGDEAELKAAIDAAKILGLKYVTIPWLESDVRNSAADYISVAKKLNYAGKRCKEAGLRLAYHNHDFEFIRYGNETGMDILLKNTDKALVDFEMDIYWVIRSGLQPYALFKANPGRFAMWHIKDMDKSDPHLNTEIGAGTIDYKAIFKHAKLSGMKYFFVEHESNYKPDMIGSIQQSNRFIKQQILK